MRITYIIRVGQNPTGSTLSVDRRKKIYAIAQTWDLIIIEDGKSTQRCRRTSSHILPADPYYFLQYDIPQINSTPADPDEFIKNFRSTLIPTFLSMDVDGRVLRIDTLVRLYNRTWLPF